MKTFMALTSPNPKTYEFTKQYIQVEFPQEEGNLSFFTYILPLPGNKALFFASWGDLFTDVGRIVLNSEDGGEILSEIWPLTVKYLTCQPRGEFGDGALLTFPGGVFNDIPNDFWVLGFEAEGIAIEDLFEFTEAGIDNVLRLSKMCLPLFLEVTDNNHLERWIIENGLIDHENGHFLRGLLNKQKLLFNFGITPTDFGPPSDNDRFIGFGLARPI